MGNDCKSICDIKETLERWVLDECRGNRSMIDTSELGEAIDMIKDLAQAKKYLCEASYYKSVSEAMENYPNERYGYRPYSPMMRDISTKKSWESDIDYYDNEHDWDSVLDKRNEPTRYGKSYDDFKMAKKHYTTTNSLIDKDEMDMRAMEHISDMMMTVREIWKASDPELKAKIKNNLAMLNNELVD